MSGDETTTSVPPPPASAPTPAADSGTANDTGKATDSGNKSGDAAAHAKDPHGAERREFEEAYRSGRYETGGSMAFIREARIGRQHFGDVIVGGGPRAPKSGSVREDYLVRIRSRYAAAPGYERMYTALAERRLLVLYGQPGTGRFTTALILLDELAAGKISRFDDEVDVESLATADFDAEGRGYVIELTGGAGAALTDAKLDKLRDLLGERCYCVVTTELDDFNSVDGYAIEYNAPDHDIVLRRHIAAEVRTDDRTDLEERLNELATTPRVAKALGPAPRPVETAEMARLLAEHGQGRMGMDEVETQANQLVQRQAVEWFYSLGRIRSRDKLKEALGLAAFRIALAVFNNSPYNIVARAGVDLAGAFSKAIAKPDTSKPDKPDEKRSLSDKPKSDEPKPDVSPPSLFSDDQTRRLPVSRAEIVDGWLAFGQVRLPVGLAKYRDDRFPVVLLSYVWQHHHNLRAAMVTWLKRLSKDNRPTIWVRAAQATGLLCSLDFHFTYPEMIESAASTDDPTTWQPNWFAAVALDQTARDERMTIAIVDRLKYWRRNGSIAQKWTAAATLGYDLGRRSMGSTLEELRVLGTPSEQQSALDEYGIDHLVVISAHSMANLLAFGEVQPVLDRLNEWTGSERQSLRELAWWAVRFLIGLHGFDLDLLWNSAGRAERPLPRTRERWPLLLALQDADPRYTKQIAELLRWGLRGRRGDYVAKHLFGPWVRAAEKDVECLRALACFLPHLVHSEADANRLHYLIIRLRRDWSDPLNDEAATLLAAAVQKEAS
jgi:hypothetical protein